MENSVFLMLMIGSLAQAQAQPQPSRGVIAAQQIPAATDSVAKLRAGRNYALLIGTSDYDDKTNWAHLPNPVLDATAIEGELKNNYGYETFLLPNPTLDQVRKKLLEYAKRSFGPNDSLLIFIAGHGKFDPIYKQGSLAFRDADGSDQVGRTYLEHAELRRKVDAINAKHILLMIDACFSGTIDDRVATRSTNTAYPQASKAEIVARNAAWKSRIFLTSGGNDYVSDGRAGAHSPFASQILGALRTNSGVLTSVDLKAVADLSSKPEFGHWGGSEPGSEFWLTANSFGKSGASVNTPPVDLAIPSRGNQGQKQPNTPGMGVKPPPNPSALKTNENAGKAQTTKPPPRNNTASRNPAPNPSLPIEKQPWANQLAAFRIRSDKGDLKAMTELGHAYESGAYGLAQDNGQAVSWYRKAADAGYSEAMYRLGVSYEYGLVGLAKDDGQALSWYRKAAGAGYSTAMYLLGRKYEDGQLGLAKDDGQALNWHRKAADAGSAASTYRIGLAYNNGQLGLAKDVGQAITWLERAAKLDPHPNAVEALKQARQSLKSGGQ
jgi:TPR repeat protein